MLRLRQRSDLTLPFGVIGVVARHLPTLLNNFIWVLLIVIVLLFSLLTERYLSIITLRNILIHASVLGLLVVGQTFVLITRNFDLSAESTLGLTAMIAVWLMAPPGSPSWGSGLFLHPVIVIPLMLALGAFIGVVNGLLITRAGMNNFIVTLAMLIILRGFMLLPTHGTTVSGAPAAFNWLGSASIGIVPIPVLVLLIVFLVAHIVMTRRPFGRELYTIGGNPRAALASGIDPDRRILQAYVLSGLLASLAGWMLAGRVQAVPINLGQGMIFEVFAAAVIGGVSLQGGRGSMLGALGGVLLLSAIDTGLNLLNVPVFWIEVVRGFIILIAMLIDAQKIRLRTISRTQ